MNLSRAKMFMALLISRDHYPELRKFEVQLAEAVKYTDCISAEGEDYPTRVPDMTQDNDGEAPVMLELWGKWSVSSLPLLPGSLWPGLVTPDEVLWAK